MSLGDVSFGKASAHDALGEPSPWVRRWTHLVAPDATVLDVACGSGRHLAWFLNRGHTVTGLDRDIQTAKKTCSTALLIEADIEANPWPLTQTFGAVVVTNYLWRPVLPAITQSVAPGGVLIYETFATGNAVFGRPSRPDFLLEPGELLAACKDFTVVAYENGTLDDPMRCVQRIAAVRKPTVKSATEAPTAYPL
jgi:SAM-dependent methyltransferase